MANLDEYWGDLDVESIPASRGAGEPLPAGEYMLAMDSSEAVVTKDGTGILLKCSFKVVEGEFEGRMVFTNMNIRNKNAQAQQIAIGEFKALCLATGVPFDVARSDTTSLMYVPFRARIGFEKAQAGYEPRNKVTKYYEAGAAVASTPAAAPVAPASAARPAAAAAPAKPAGGGLPWKKSA